MNQRRPRAGVKSVLITQKNFFYKLVKSFQPIYLRQIYKVNAVDISMQRRVNWIHRYLHNINFS